MSPADSPFASLPAPGPHPATAVLRAYAAGTLAPADEHRIEAHVLDCERCADLVEGFSMSDAATTDRAVAELRTRLQARLGQEEPAPVASSWAWPRIAAAAALVAAVGGGIWTLERPDSDKAPATARINTSAPAPSAATPAPAPEPAVASAPEAAAKPGTAPETTAATASTTQKPADYAAVAPSQTRRRAVSRTMREPRPSADDFADRSTLADMEAAPASPVMGAPAKPSEASITNSAGYAATAAAAEQKTAADKKSETALAGRAATDSVRSLGEVVVASRMVKAKTAPSSAAPAMVLNTPMPVTPAINPAPVGGTLAMRDYLRREASQFVPEINNLRISGTVRVRFIVEADGKLSNIKVTRGIRKDYDDEALRLVCEGPAWQPGIAGGKRAPLPMEVTVPF